MASFSTFARCISPLLLCLHALAASAQGVSVLGPAEIVSFLTPYLPEGGATDAAGREQLQRQLEKSLPELLATEGYFSPQLEFAWKDAGVAVTLRPGPQTRITAVEIAIEGSLTPQTREAFVAGWSLPVGQTFRQADWSRAKESLLGKLLAEEYAGAALKDSSAEIDPAQQTARLKLLYDAGPRWRFGPLKIIGLSRYHADLLARYNLGVREGEVYSEEKLRTLQHALQSTPYFSSVEVALDKADATLTNGEARAPVLVRLSERQPHRLGFGAGISSNTGARGEMNFHSNDFLRRAWELNSGLRLEQKKSAVYADVFLPPDQAQARDSLGVVAETANIQGLHTDSVSVGTQRVQQRGQLEVRFSLNWQLERQKPDAAVTTTNRALVLNSMWTWRQVDSLLEPRHGLVAQVQAGGASRSLLSDRDFLRLSGRLQYYLPLGQKDQLMLRGEAGRTLANSRDGIPQDYLFRTGGTGSVRGYAYQSLGVSEGGAVLGGRYLLGASVEATHWLDEKWGAAIFFDEGNATDSRPSMNLQKGYGFGGRWKSPAGPLALDLAWAESTKMPRLHFALAIPF